MKVGVPFGEDLVLSVFQDVLSASNLQPLQSLYFGDAFHFFKGLGGVAEVVGPAVEETGTAEVHHVFIDFCEF